MIFNKTSAMAMAHSVTIRAPEISDGTLHDPCAVSALLGHVLPAVLIYVDLPIVLHITLSIS